MSDEIGELFGEGDGAPRPRTRLALGLLTVGLVSTVVGMACTTAPGGLLVLGGWMVVEKDQERLESGYFAEDLRVGIEATRTFATWSVATAVLLFVVQGVLLCSGFYDPLWMGILSSFLGVG